MALSAGIQLIVGLANPGKEYADTRHNAGAWLIDQINQSEGTRLRMETKFQGLHTLFRLDNQSCHLLIPTTFMNLSGQSVQACMRYYNIPIESLLVAHDEIDLPVGTTKLKFDGGDGGHNGLKDIIRHLHSKKFYRLRIGVGRPQSKQAEVVDYVLSPPSKADRHKIDQTITAALQILPLLLVGKMQQAMQQLHTE